MKTFLKQLLIIISLLICSIVSGQCVDGEDAQLYPIGPYKSGDIVEVCYQLEKWNELGGASLNGFQINVSDEWIILPPTVPPNDNFITSNGNWIWLDSSTTFDEGAVGPGWFYEWVNSADGNPLNDPGDWTGSIIGYQPHSSWNMCFQVQLKNICEHRELNIEIIALGDLGYCDPVPFTAYNGENEINVDSCITYLYIPNAFTPNGDGSNDKLYVIGQAIREMRWCIYNRWGKIVFESNSPLVGWDGNGHPTGVFTYIIDYTSTNNQYYRNVGSVILIR